MGTREQEQGKERVAALTIWTLHMPGVSFRVLGSDPNGNCCLHTKRGSGRWALSPRGGTARELFDHVTRTVYQAWGRSEAPTARDYNQHTTDPDTLCLCSPCSKARRAADI